MKSIKFTSIGITVRISRSALHRFLSCWEIKKKIKYREKYKNILHKKKEKKAAIFFNYILWKPENALLLLFK